jgi:hypothetical protein
VIAALPSTMAPVKESAPARTRLMIHHGQ